MSRYLNDWSGKMSRVQNFWVSKCLYFYAVSQCLGVIMSGWQNVLLSKCLGAQISCHLWVSKRGLSKCPGADMSDCRVPKCRRITRGILLYAAGAFQVHFYTLQDAVLCTLACFDMTLMFKINKHNPECTPPGYK